MTQQEVRNHQNLLLLLQIFRLKQVSPLGPDSGTKRRRSVGLLLISPPVIHLNHGDPSQCSQTQPGTVSSLSSGPVR